MVRLAAPVIVARAPVFLVGKLWATAFAGFWATSLSTSPASSTGSEVEEVGAGAALPAVDHQAVDLNIWPHQTLAPQEDATPHPAQPVEVLPPHTRPLLIPQTRSP